MNEYIPNGNIMVIESGDSTEITRQWCGWWWSGSGVKESDNTLSSLLSSTFIFNNFKIQRTKADKYPRKSIQKRQIYIFNFQRCWWLSWFTRKAQYLNAGEYIEWFNKTNITVSDGSGFRGGGGYPASSSHCALKNIFWFETTTGGVIGDEGLGRKIFPFKMKESSSNDKHNAGETASH